MLDERALAGSWVHSHEEDTDQEKVFRPQGYAFPPSRGREALELRPDGSCTRRAPGPTDEPEASAVSWELDGSTLLLRSGSEGEQARAVEVVSVEPEKLVVRG